MAARRSRVPLAILLSCAWAGPAAAQSAPTCSFDAATATLTITVNGQPANISPHGGQIRLNGVDCVGATPSTTDLITVNGGVLDDSVTLTGANQYRPGLTAEDDASSEIEMVFDLGGGRDEARFGFLATRAVWFTAGGIDISHDGDEDITTTGVETVRVDGSPGDDVIHGEDYLGGGTLELHAGAGDDTIYGSAQGDLLYGEAGNDTLSGRDGDDFLTGGPGNDNMVGSSGADRFVGDPVADGSDVMRGGDGFDAVYYQRRTSPVNVTLGNDLADDGEAGEGDLLLHVESVFGGKGDDVLVGSDVANDIQGGAGNDEIDGGAGDDLLDGQNGDDIIVGGDGNDQIRGLAGNDQIWGGTGDDLVDGGDGNDNFTAEASADGNDAYYGGNGNDALTYADRTVGVNVTLGNGLADDGEPGSEADLADESIEALFGGGGDDVLVGTAAANNIFGQAGDDEIYGGAGKDNLVGGDGNDILVGDAGNDSLRGDQGADSLDGGDGNDFLFGGIGADTLTGGPGTDTFHGEAGTDTFFNADAYADTVDCGPGTADDAEPDPLDTFTGCEL